MAALSNADAPAALLQCKPLQKLKEEFDFDGKQELGSGTFGDIYKIARIKTGQLYAIKQINREEVGEVNIQREIFALKLFNSPFIIKLYNTYKHVHDYYFIMDLAENGDLKAQLVDNGPFNLRSTRFFTAELVSALEYLRSKSFVHRDIKCENILLDSTFHIKLTDFGGAKIVGQSQGTSIIANTVDKNSMTGTYSMLAPEVLKAEPVTFGTDYWNLAFVIFALYARGMLAELKGPLVVDDYLDHVENCMWWYPFDKPDPLVHDLLYRLTRRNPNDRLGTVNFNDLKSHPFFMIIEWNNLQHMKSPGCQKTTARTNGHKLGRDMPVMSHPPAAAERTSSSTRQLASSSSTQQRAARTTPGSSSTTLPRKTPPPVGPKPQRPVSVVAERVTTPTVAPKPQLSGRSTPQPTSGVTPLGGRSTPPVYDPSNPPKKPPRMKQPPMSPRTSRPATPSTKVAGASPRESPRLSRTPSQTSTAQDTSFTRRSSSYLLAMEDGGFEPRSESKRGTTLGPAGHTPPGITLLQASPVLQRRSGRSGTLVGEDEPTKRGRTGTLVQLADYGDVPAKPVQARGAARTPSRSSVYDTPYGRGRDPTYDTPPHDRRSAPPYDTQSDPGYDTPIRAVHGIDTPSTPGRVAEPPKVKNIWHVNPYAIETIGEHTATTGAPPGHRAVDKKRLYSDNEPTYDEVPGNDSSSRTGTTGAPPGSRAVDKKRLYSDNEPIYDELDESRFDAAPCLPLRNLDRSRYGDQSFVSMTSSASPPGAVGGRASLNASTASAGGAARRNRGYFVVDNQLYDARGELDSPGSMGSFERSSTDKSHYFVLEESEYSSPDGIPESRRNVSQTRNDFLSSRDSSREVSPYAVPNQSGLASLNTGRREVSPYAVVDVTADSFSRSRADSRAPVSRPHHATSTPMPDRRQVNPQDAFMLFSPVTGRRNDPAARSIPRLSSGSDSSDDFDPSSPASLRLASQRGVTASGYDPNASRTSGYDPNASRSSGYDPNASCISEDQLDDSRRNIAISLERMGLLRNSSTQSLRDFWNEALRSPPPERGNISQP